MNRPDHTELLRELYHAVNSPLNSIFNLTEMMLLGIEGEMSGEVRQDIQTIADDAQRLHRAVEGILAFIRTLTTEYPIQPINIVELLKTLVNEPAPPLTIQLPAIAQPVFVTGNEEMLRLLFQKLFSFLRQSGNNQTMVITMQSDGDLIRFSIAHEQSNDGTIMNRDFASSLDLLLCEHLLRLQGEALWFETSITSQIAVCISLRKSS